MSEENRKLKPKLSIKYNTSDLESEPITIKIENRDLKYSTSFWYNWWFVIINSIVVILTLTFIFIILFHYFLD